MRLAAISLAAILVSCSHQSTPAGPDAGEPGIDWDHLPTGTSATYQPGTQTPMVQQTIGALGGTLQGPAGSALAGIRVDFPAGALRSDTQFSLGTDSGAFQGLPDGASAGPIIVLTSSGQHYFDQPVSIVWPYPDASVALVLYFLDDQGQLSVIGPAQTDSQAHTATFLTWHASMFGGVGSPANSTDDSFTTSFSTSDGFAFENEDTEYLKGGLCFGMSTWALWYLRTQGPGFVSKFLDPVPTETVGKTLKGQEVIASRAHSSVTRVWTQYQNMIKSGDNGVNIASIRAALRATNKPVLVYLNGPAPAGPHAVVAYAFAGEKIRIYDPNYPQVPQIIACSGRLFVYDGYSDICLVGDGALPWAEPFNTILQDAQAGFHGENEAKIEVTNHKSGDVVTGTTEVELTGTLQSGQIAVAELSIDSGADDPAGDDRVTLTKGDPNWTKTVKLNPGSNTILFFTRGLTSSATDLVYVANSTELNIFTLVAPVLGGISVTATGVRVSGDPSDPDQRDEWSYTFSTDLSFRIFKLTMQEVLNGSFPFDTCDSASCLIVTGQSTPTPDQSTPILPVHVKYSQQTYSKTKNGFELIRKEDGDGTQSWTTVNLMIAVEPKSTKDSRQYRVLVEPGCNNTVCAPANVPMFTSQCLDPDTETWSACEGGLLTIPPLAVLTQTDNDHLDTITPPRVPAADFEDFVMNATASKTWTLAGTQRDTASDPSSTSDVTVSLTLVP
jgi:hypothetical protein